MCEERRTTRGPETWGLIGLGLRGERKTLRAAERAFLRVGEGTVKPRAGAEDSRGGKHAVGETDLRS